MYITIYSSKGLHKCKDWATKSNITIILNITLILIRQYYGRDIYKVCNDDLITKGLEQQVEQYKLQKLHQFTLKLGKYNKCAILGYNNISLTIYLICWTGPSIASNIVYNICIIIYVLNCTLRRKRAGCKSVKLNWLLRIQLIWLMEKREVVNEDHLDLMFRVKTRAASLI